MQHKIEKRHPLLNEKGELIECGYANSLILDYDRKAIKASKWRIKEWDYYLITNEKYAVALTIADNSYMGLDSISLLDLTENPWEKTVSKMQAFTWGKKNLPSTSESGDVFSKGKKHFIKYINKGNERHISFEMKNFLDKKTIKGEFIIESPNEDSMVIVTPYKEDKKAFYYNQKINCMPTSGRVQLGDKIYEFSKEDTFACLDWGRGVWLRKGVWYWGTCSSLHKGERFGFNIGYGFGDTSAASENMIFYKGKAHKLDLVDINIPKDEKGKYDYMKPWVITSNDKRFEMTFEPILDRKANINILIIGSDQHQVFGKISGKAVLDDGEVLEIENCLCAVEHIKNKW
jgi:hypothetical protein